MSGTVCHYGNNIADCWTRRRVRFTEFLLRVLKWYREWKNCTSDGSTSPWHFCTNRFRSSTQYSLMNTLTELCENLHLQKIIKCSHIYTFLRFRRQQNIRDVHDIFIHCRYSVHLLFFSFLSYSRMSWQCEKTSKLAVRSLDRRSAYLQFRIDCTCSLMWAKIINGTDRNLPGWVYLYLMMQRRQKLQAEW